MPPIDVKQFTGLTSDSRAVKPGYLFAALAGAKVHGREYIEDAIAKGAVAILADKGTVIDNTDVALIENENPRRALALMAAEFYERQPAHVVAVTGTNGKTSVVTFTQQLWEALGYKAASMGTLSGSLTTLDPVALHEQLAKCADQGVTHLALEASSHGLHQYRLDGVQIEAAGFTSFSRDHMDYHETEEEYLAAKACLFSEVLPEDGTAVLNADIPQYGMLYNHNRAVGEISYGYSGDGIRLLKAEPVAGGQELKLEVIGQPYDLILPLVGSFQVMNALCALGLVIAIESENHQRNRLLIEAMKTLKPVRGRLEYVDGHPEDVGIYVDYAHTPDALENILNALRPHTKGRLVCVFGCGGDRDKGKRPQMGEIAVRLADHTIVTDDNPRSEDPAQIRKEIMAAAKGAEEVGGRRAAIKAALEMAKAGDIVVVAGKGHEQGQIFKDHTEKFDDVTVIKEVLEALNNYRETPEGEKNE